MTSTSSVRPAPWHALHLPKELACEFLGVFSRAEYALKAAGFVKVQHGVASPDWDRFGRAVNGAFDMAATPDLQAKAAYLLKHPPARQTYVNGQLGWAPLVAGPASLPVQLTVCIRCVRNNLFHGGKYVAPPPSSPDRDILLVSSALGVLDALIGAHSEVASAYDAH